MSASDARLSRRRLIRPGGVYTIEEENSIELEEVPPTEPVPPEEPSERWNTDKIPQEEWQSSGT